MLSFLFTVVNCFTVKASENTFDNPYADLIEWHLLAASERYCIFSIQDFIYSKVKLFSVIFH